MLFFTGRVETISSRNTEKSSDAKKTILANQLPEAAANESLNAIVSESVTRIPSNITTDVSPRERPNSVVVFKIEKIYRGVLSKFIEISTSSKFQEGQPYFVYAVRGKDAKLYKMDDGYCGTPPILLKNAAEDLEYAEDIAAGKLGTRIYGFVIEDKWELFKSQENVPLEGIEVTIQNKEYRFTTKTNEKGKYMFKNIPVGLYEVNAQIPSGLRDRKNFPKRNTIGFSRRNLKPNQVYIGEDVSNEISLTKLFVRKTSYRYWDSLSFSVNSFGSVRGKFIGHDGTDPPQLFVQLFLLDKNGRVNLDDPIAYQWTNSKNDEFYFDRVPKGKFVVGINRYDCHQNRNPQYGRTFFPGVTVETEATTITARSGQDFDLGNFQLLPPLKERSFSGTVVDADKKPVADATVIMKASVQKTSNECVAGNSIETKTDENGRFTLKGFESYVYKILAYKELDKKEKSAPRISSARFETPLEGKVDNIRLLVD